MTIMATKVRLAVGERDKVQVVVTVTEAVEVEGNYGPQARITGYNDTGDVVTLYEKLDAVNRQLGRCGLSMANMAGERLAFWKETATNGSGQSFPALRIDTMRGGAAPAPPSAPAATPVAGIDTPAEVKYSRYFAAAEEMTECLILAEKIAAGRKLAQYNGDHVGAIERIAVTLFLNGRGK